MPHLSLFLKQAGITPSEMAVMGCITPLLGLITRPLFGALADKFKWHKQLQVLCLLANGLFFSLMLLLPTRDTTTSPVLPRYGLVVNTASENCSGPLQLVPVASNASCSIPVNMTACNVLCPPSNFSVFINSTNSSCVTTDASVFIAVLTDNCIFDCASYSYTWANYKTSDFSSYAAASECLPPELRQQPKRSYRIDITGSWVFYVWMLVRSAAYVFFHPCFNLQDAMVYSVIGENRAQFGHVRSFGSMGFFVFALVTSAVVHSTRIGSRIIFWPAILIYDILMLISACSVSMYQINSAQASRNLFKAVGSALKKLELTVLLVFLTATGILNTMFEIYIFWYLADLKGTPLLYGVMLAVNCLFETPCIILAGRLIARIGEVPCMFLVFAAYSLRFIVYSFIENPWMCLIVEPLQGITMGVHLVAYTGYMARTTERNALGSMQGLASGMHYGLGGFIGSLVGGFTYDAFGPRTLYRGCSIFALVCLFAYIFVQYCIVKRCSKTDVSAPQNASSKNRPIVIAEGRNGKHMSDQDAEELKNLNSENGHQGAIAANA